jgi:AraC-like DNA-binding protein
MIIDYFCVCSGFLGIVIFFTLLIHFKKNRMVNIYLLFLIFFISIKFIFIGIEHNTILLQYVYQKLRDKYLFIIFIPCTYLYLQNLKKDIKYLNTYDLRHFIIPFICFFNLCCFDITINKTVLFSIIIILIIFYLHKIYSLFKDKIWNCKSDFKFINKQNKIIEEWAILILIINTLISIRFLITLHIEYLNTKTLNDNPFQIFSVLFFDIALIKIITSPELLFGIQSKNYHTYNIDNLNHKLKYLWSEKNTKIISNTQDEILNQNIRENIFSYCISIENLFISTKILRDSKITFDEISKKLNIPKSHLAFIFKYHCKVNYNEFKNIVRVYDSLELIENGFLKKNTLESLCIKVGFTSYNPFYRKFKEISGVTPQIYSKNYM